MSKSESINWFKFLIVNRLLLLLTCVVIVPLNQGIEQALRAHKTEHVHHISLLADRLVSFENILRHLNASKQLVSRKF